MSLVQTAREFIRALKAPRDPPIVGGPSKIEIACQAWNANTIYLPNRAEVIAEWVLSTLLKEKSQHTSTSPIFDINYWKLLLEILAEKDSTNSRPPKVWLALLLRRISLQPILLVFLAGYQEADAQIHHDELAASVYSCFALMWPISAQKMSPEDFADLFGVLLQKASEGPLSLGIVNIGILVTSSYRSSLSNSVNKKKFYLLFLRSFFNSWLPICAGYGHQETSEHKCLSQYVYDSGTDTLFNLEILRQLADIRATEQSTFLFDHLRTARATQASNTLETIPRLFSSFVQALMRHRGAVFVQNSNIGNAIALNEEINAAAMRFFRACELIVGQEGYDTVGEDVEVWKARLNLLQVVLDEKLFDTRQEDAAVVLNRIIEDAICVLGSSWKDEQSDAISPATMCLYKIGQIDCDLLIPAITRILPLVLPISMADSASSLFLDIILDYHTKTRTLNTYINNLLASFTPSSLTLSTTTDMHQVYEKCFMGHLLSTRHLTHLGSALRKFLTPGQALRSVEGLLEALRDSWHTFLSASEVKDDDNESPKKKRRKEMDEDESEIDVGSKARARFHTAESLAVALALQAYLSITVLSNLPMKSLAEESANAVKAMIGTFRDTLVRKYLVKLLKPRRLMLEAGQKKRKRQSSAGRGGWETQIVAAAMLRLHYALCVAEGLNLGDNLDAGKIVDQAREIVEKEDGGGRLRAELRLEIFRVLLYHISNDEQQTGASQILESLLSYLNLASKSTGCTWSGLHCLLKDTDTGALALLHLVMERWLPLFDCIASPAQLTNMVQLILSVNLDAIPQTTNSSSLLHPAHLLLRLLHSADFWEMHNFRTAFLSHLIRVTDIPESSLKESEMAVYRLLLYTPTEYLTKPARAHFIRRAYTADVQLVKSLRNKGEENPTTRQHSAALQTLINLRAFLRRIICLEGYERIPEVDLGDFIIHLISFDSKTKCLEYDMFVQSTLELTELCFSELLKMSSSSSNALLKIIGTLSQYPIFTGRGNGPDQLHSKAILKLLDVVTRTNDISSFPTDAVAALCHFHSQVSGKMHERLSCIPLPELHRYSVALSGWSCILKLRKWLSEGTEQTNSRVGRRLVSLVSQESDSDERLDDVRAPIFSILRAELGLELELGDRQKQLDLLIAAYLIFYPATRSSTRVQLDEHVSLISRSLTPEDYQHILSLLSESLSTDSTPSDKLEIILHLSILLLQDHPQRTLKCMQAFFSRCLSIFCSRRMFIEGSVPLRLLTLEFVTQHCSERPATLRPTDLESVWTILLMFLEQSEEHDDSTTPEIFHKIVASIGALVRLRRDLLTPVLPHLGLALRHLLSSVRSCRPQLGMKQTAVVMRTQPRWISTKQSLGCEEGRMLSRLFETLNTKTMIRSHTASEAQKAESLGKPFSKHAAYVLGAYIEALNDPLCVLSMELRRELEPGLFVLCSLMGEHARDAMVVWLDAGGKAALKLIWKDYEKQRYVGKG